MHLLTLMRSSSRLCAKLAGAVVTTRAKALTSATPGDYVPGSARVGVFLITMCGHFTAIGGPGPPGAKAPAGRYVSLVINARTFQGLDFGISPWAAARATRQPGAGHLSGWGRRPLTGGVRSGLCILGTEPRITAPAATKTRANAAGHRSHNVTGIYCAQERDARRSARRLHHVHLVPKPCQRSGVRSGATADIQDPCRRSRQ
jgi:hypothetical protein